MKNYKDLQRTVNGVKDILGRRAVWFPPLTFPKASLVSFLWVVICMTVPALPMPLQEGLRASSLL